MSHQLAALSLTSPFMLWGMLAIALPLLAHMLNRRTRRRIVFPTVALLSGAAASQSRVFRLRRWIVLALRCAAVIFLVWAFARPVWTDSRAAAGGDSTGGTAVVLVLDVSASSGQRIGGVRIVDHMAATAQRVLDELEGGSDVANVIYAGARPRAAYPDLITNFEALHAELRGLEPTSERADLPGAIALAASMLEDHKRQPKIIVLSDMQQTNWTDFAAAGHGPAAQWLTITPVGHGAAVNTGLGRPHVQPGRPIVGRAARLNATVVNFAPAPRTVTVRTHVGERPVGTQTVSLEAGEQQSVSFEVMLNEAGPQMLTLTTDGDDFSVDDRHYLVVEATQRIPVALVTDADPSQPTNAAYFIARALAPAGNDSDAFEVVTLRSSDLDAEKLRDVQAVILSEIGQLNVPAVQALLDHATAGGGVLMFLAESSASANVAAFDRIAGESPIAPFQPLQVLESGAWRLAEGAWASDTLESFDELSRLALQGIAFHRAHATGELREGAQVVLAFDDGIPALALGEHGRGRLMLANFSPAPAASSLAKHGAFVALLHGMVAALSAGDGAEAVATVGQPLQFSISDIGQAASVHAPDGIILPITTRSEVNGLLSVQAPAASQPGFYRLVQGDRTVAVRAVNIDERESDLRRVMVGDVPSPATRSRREQASMSTANGEGITALERDVPIWWWCILAAAAAAGMEMLLLCLWRR